MNLLFSEICCKLNSFCNSSLSCLQNYCENYRGSRGDMQQTNPMQQGKRFQNSLNVMICAFDFWRVSYDDNQRWAGKNQLRCLFNFLWTVLTCFRSQESFIWLMNIHILHDMQTAKIFSLTTCYSPCVFFLSSRHRNLLNKFPKTFETTT